MRSAVMASRNFAETPEAAGSSDRARRDGSLGYVIMAAHRAFTRALRQRLEPHGVTLAQWYFLRELWQDEGLNQRELSRRVGVSEPTTVTALNLMARRDLIERRRENGDRRTLYVYLTPKGRALRRSLLRDGLVVNADAARDLPAASVERVKRLLLQMIDNLD
jgi:MarR family transcriptional regulator, organic hydroperoxide resistance regulator